MDRFLSILVRLLLVAAGLVFTASVAVVAAVLALVWAVGAGWARLTGKPVRRFASFRMHRGSPFAARPAESRTPRADAVRSLRGRPDVVDVEPR